jgi:hypothetical protein
MFHNPYKDYFVIAILIFAINWPADIHYAQNPPATLTSLHSKSAPVMHNKMRPSPVLVEAHAAKGDEKTTRVISTHAEEASDPLRLASDAPWLVAPAVELTSPNGSEWWLIGDNQEIRWNASTEIANVKIEFSGDGGASWSALVASTPNDGAHSWEVPDTVSNACMIRIADAVDGSIADVSNGTFFITLGALVNFTPSENNPVLLPGQLGSWDENIRERGFFMYENGTYHVWYGGWRGDYDHSVSGLVKLGYAYSEDGVHWVKHAENPIYDQNWIEDPCLVQDNGTYYMYAENEYNGGDKLHIHLYTSTDKIHWTRYGGVLYPAGEGWEALEVATPTVWKDGGIWYMLYEGLGNTTGGQVGLAQSRDGKNWTKHENNPVLSNPLGTHLDIAIDSIVKVRGVYYAYGHYDVGGTWAGGMFTSTDLMRWTAYSGNPITYNSPVIVDNGTEYLIYGVGDRGYAPYSMSLSKHPPSSEVPVTKTTSFHPTDDAYVRSSNPKRNFGVAGDLRVRKTSSVEVHTYLKFNMTGLEGHVQSAKIRLHVLDGSNDGGAVFAVSNDYRDRQTAWTEEGLTWNNAPLSTGKALSFAGAADAGQTVEFDVTAAIIGNGVYSFGIKKRSADAVHYSSKEGAAPPELVIQSSVEPVAGQNGEAQLDTSGSGQNHTVPPKQSVLYPNYPNPFRTATQISYRLLQRSEVRLAVYDLMGRELKILAHEEQNAGRYEIGWDGRDAKGALVPSGVYIYSVEVGAYKQTKKLVIIR